MTEVFGIDVEERITSGAELRDIIAPPNARTADKVIDHVDDLARKFIAASPFAVIASRRPDGHLDLSPRGDPPGFARVLNKKTLVLPDRAGNRRMDTFENILRDPYVGLYFLIPGHKDTLRISGRAALVMDKKLAAHSRERNSVAEILLLIHVERVLSHCPKCMLRSGLWDHERWPKNRDVPTLAEMMVRHSELSISVEGMQDIIDRDAKTRVYSSPEEYFGHVNLDTNK